MQQRSLWQVLATYGVASWAVYQVSLGLRDGLGLPDRLPLYAFILMLVGLPIVVATWLVQRRLALLPHADDAIHRHLTWGRTAIGGVLAFLLLAVTTAAVTVTKNRATLFAQGVLDANDPVLLADFTSAPDTTLGNVITEAMRVDLLQSRGMRMAQPARIAAGLRRMNKGGTESLTPSLARELAERDGYKAIISGDVKQVAGVSYLLTARVTSAKDSILVAFSETAKDSTDLIPAVHRLSRTMREKMGESLKTIRAEKPLAQVTTASLPAFRKYSEAARVARETADMMREKALLIEAVQLDTMFASAWRRLGVVTQGDSSKNALTRAYDLRDHLTDLERFQAIASYEAGVRNNRAAAIDAHRQALAVDSLDITSLNSLAVLLAHDRRWAEAEVLLRRAKNAEGDGSSWSGLWVMQYWQGHLAEAKATLDSALVALPNNLNVYFGRIVWAGAQQKWDLADSLAVAGLEQFRDNRFAKPGMAAGRAMAAVAQGRLAAANALANDMAVDLGVSNDGRTRLLMALDRAKIFREDIPRAKRELQAALSAVPLASLPDEQRPYSRLSILCGAVADFACADDAIRGLERQKATDESLNFARGYLFLHKGNAAAALPCSRRSAALARATTVRRTSLRWRGSDSADRIPHLPDSSGI